MTAFNVKIRASASSEQERRDDGTASVPVEDTLLPFIKREIPKARIDIQKNIENQHSVVWKFLNSALGLSLLTGVMITGGANLHRNALRAAAEDGAAEDELLKSTSEFSYRLVQIDFFRRKFGLDEAVVNNYQVAGIGSIIRGEERTIDNIIDFRPSSPEFKDKSLLVVVDQLKSFGITEGADKVSQALNSIENADSDNYLFLLKDGVFVLREYRDKSIATALKKPRGRGWVRRVLGF